jgi:cbb3-type cytochrome oxidase maturation protein
VEKINYIPFRRDLSLKKRKDAMTLWTTLALLIFGALVLGLTAWLLFIWAVKSGQFDDIEGPKYRIFDEDDDEPRPATDADPDR